MRNNIFAQHCCCHCGRLRCAVGYFFVCSFVLSSVFALLLLLLLLFFLFCRLIFRNNGINAKYNYRIVLFELGLSHFCFVNILIKSPLNMQLFTWNNKKREKYNRTIQSYERKKTQQPTMEIKKHNTFSGILSYPINDE